MAEETQWWDHAACKGEDTDIFTGAHRGQIAYVKKLCASCPVNSECADDATNPHAPPSHHYMRAGMTQNQIMNRRKRRQRKGAN